MNPIHYSLLKIKFIYVLIVSYSSLLVHIFLYLINDYAITLYHFTDVLRTRYSGFDRLIWLVSSVAFNFYLVLNERLDPMFE